MNLPLGPISISEDTWMYVDPDVLHVIHWSRVKGGMRRREVHSIQLPWAQVRLALAKRDKKKHPRDTVAKDGTARRSARKPVGRRAETQKGQ